MHIKFRFFFLVLYECSKEYDLIKILNFFYEQDICHQMEQCVKSKESAIGDMDMLHSHSILGLNNDYDIRLNSALILTVTFRRVL